MKIFTLVGIGALFCAAIMFVPTRAEPPRRDDEASADKAGAVKLVGEKKDVSDLLKSDIAELQKALSAAKPEKKDLKRARVLAVVIALNAQALGDDETMAICEQASIVAAVIVTVSMADDDASKKE